MWPDLKLNEDVHKSLFDTFSLSHETKTKYKMKAMLKILSIPPRYTTMRCLKTDENFTLVKDTINDREIEKSGLGYKIYKHSIMDDVIIVENKPSKTSEISHKEVIVDEACGAAVLRGSDIFVPGILSISPDVKKGDKVSIYIDLNGKCLKGLMEKFQGERLFIATGVSRICRKEVFSTNMEGACNEKRGVGVEVHDNVFQQAISLHDLLPSILFPQNLPSLVCVHVLSPLSASLVFDMCAAPGGKTTHIASLIGEKGRVVALDKNKGKVVRLKNNLQRLGITNVNAFSFDATQSYLPTADDSLTPPYKSEFFDRILVDAPCSGLGQRPCFSHPLLTNNQLSSYPVLQKRIMKNAIPLLKSKGVLVYSTCTINPEENEGVVEWVLRKFPNMILNKQDVHLGGYGWKREGLTDEQLKLLQRFDPSVLIKTCHIEKEEEKQSLNIDNEITMKDYLNYNLNENLVTPETDTIGFFIAKFIKK